MDDATELFSIQDKIKDYEYKQLNVARLRAKVQEIEQGERCRYVLFCKFKKAKS